MKESTEWERSAYGHVEISGIESDGGTPFLVKSFDPDGKLVMQRELSEKEYRQFMKWFQYVTEIKNLGKRSEN